MINLEMPNVKYKDSFLAAVKECREWEGTDISGFIPFMAKINDEKLAENFEDFVENCRDINNGDNAKIWGCPTTQLWMIEEGCRFVGAFDIRHKLVAGQEYKAGHIGYFIVPSAQGRGYAEKGLDLALKYAGKLGIYVARVCCHKENAASRRVIEKNLISHGGERLDDFRESRMIFNCFDLYTK